MSGFNLLSNWQYSLRVTDFERVTQDAVLCHDLASDRGQKDWESALGTILLVGTTSRKTAKVLLVPAFWWGIKSGVAMYLHLVTQLRS